MGKFFLDEEKVRIAFDDGEYCDIKEELTLRDSEYIAKEVSKSGEIGALPMLEKYIIAWSFVENDMPVPINADTISHLRTKYRVPIMSKISELTQEAQAFSKK